MDWWLLLAWLWLIRFGMEVFEEAIKKLWGIKLRNVLQRYTNKGWKAVLTGTITTGILNSSTLLSLLTLGFVGAGMMSLLSAIGVLVGANIGSTFLGIIVGYIWFWDFSISMFALPLVATGGLMMIVTNNMRRWYWAKLFLGFWLFFLGIHFLKENVDAISMFINFEHFSEMNLWIFGLAWLAITMLVQSSGAVTVMTLTALSAWLISFDAWFAIILGSAIGTTSTALVASLWWGTSKKQLSVANFIFNLITVVLGVLFFRQFIYLTLDVLGFRDQQALGIAIINAVFSTITSLLFIPILPWFTKIIQKLVPEKHDDYPLQIFQVPLDKQEQRYNEDIASISLAALEQDKNHIVWQVMLYISSIRGINSQLIQENFSKKEIRKNTITINAETHKKLYDDITEQLDALFAYINKLSHTSLDHDDREELIKLQQQFINLSNAFQATESIKEHITIIKHSSDTTLKEVQHEIMNLIISLNRVVNTILSDKKLKKKEALKEIIHEVNIYRDNILDRVAPFLHKGDIGELDVSSLVNVTRELADEFKDIASALGA